MRIIARTSSELIIRDSAATLRYLGAFLGALTYRIAVTLADQRRIPWTSYYTSGLASKQAVVDAARDFLRLEDRVRR